MADPDFNSSDIEFDAEPDPFDHYGARSIEAMFESRHEDRVATKKRMANLKDTKGAPNTVAFRALWMKRFEAYMTRIRGLSVQQVTGDDIARFIECICSKIVPHSLGGKKLIPNLSTLQNSIWALSSALVFKLDFRLTRRDAVRIDTVLDALVKEGKLLKGRWRKRERVGFHLLRTIGRAWFTRPLTHGCESWDVIISRFLAISLQAATASRAGDITRSLHYKGLEYMRWEHIQMELEGVGYGEEPGVQHMTARLEIAYEKGDKDVLNKNKVVFIKALDDVQNNVVCPIKLLLVHALRTGHVAQTSIESLLAVVQATPNRTVQWLRPSDPVVPAVHRHKHGFLDFSKPANPMQVTSTLRAAGLLAGVLVPLQSHDIRAGASRDVSKLPPDAIKGVAGVAVAKVLGHTPKTTSKGLTDDYVGGIDTAVNALVAKNAKADRVAPKIGRNPYVKRRIPPAEIDEFCEEHGLDPSVSTHRRKATLSMHQQDQDRWAEEQRAALSRPADVGAASGASAAPSRKPQQHHLLSGPTASHRNPLADMSPNVRPAKRLRQGKNNNTKAIAHDKASFEPATGSDAVQTGGVLLLPTSEQPPHATMSDALIDPLLLRGPAPSTPVAGHGLAAAGPEEDAEAEDALLESTPVDPTSVSSLESLIAAANSTDDVVGGGGDADHDDNDQEAEAGGDDSPETQAFEAQIQDHIINDALDEAIVEHHGSSPAQPGGDPASVLDLPGTQFVDHLARINIVRNKTLTRNPSRCDELLPEYVGVGNSRDKPALFLHHCPNAALGCKYTSTNPTSVRLHADNCNRKLENQTPEAVFKKVVERPFRYNRDGCTTTWRTQSTLNDHVRDVHDFKSKTCELPDCPTPDREWSTASSYRAHVKRCHDEDWTPSKCQVPNCVNPTVFKNWNGYNQHLKEVHNLRGVEKEKYLPSATPHFTPRGCPINGCKNKKVFPQRSMMKKHLIQAHKFKEGDQLQSLLKG